MAIRKGKKCGRGYIPQNAKCRYGRSNQTRTIGLTAAAIGGLALGTYGISRGLKGRGGGVGAPPAPRPPNPRPPKSLNVVPPLGGQRVRSSPGSAIVPVGKRRPPIDISRVRPSGANAPPLGGQMVRSANAVPPLGGRRRRSSNMVRVGAPGLAGQAPRRISINRPKNLESTNFKTVDVPSQIISERRSVPGGIVTRGKVMVSRGVGRHNRAIRGAWDMVRAGRIIKGPQRIRGARSTPKILTSAEQRERDYRARKKAEFIQKGNEREAKFFEDLGQAGREIGGALRTGVRWLFNTGQFRKRNKNDSFYYDYDYAYDDVDSLWLPGWYD